MATSILIKTSLPELIDEPRPRLRMAVRGDQDPAVLTKTHAPDVTHRPQRSHVIRECQSEAAIVVWQAMRDTPDVSEAGNIGLVAGRSTIRMMTG